MRYFKRCALKICHFVQKQLFSICILIYRTGDKQRPSHQYLSLLVLRHELFTDRTKGKSELSIGPGGENSQNLSHLYNLKHYRCFNASSFRALTCKLITLLWSFPRCTENSDCRNPCGFRIPDNVWIWNICTRTKSTIKCKYLQEIGTQENKDT